uniref:Uncharacterized protein n=1 Tax=Coccolithus braarudii TaxID=221442 RepID=A0A7S0L992_9EUKA|mmetsp:Transcript_2714/g.5650  ORF Transcript_2714/g.5650 Transcript_2714/m.5650 type:complete len:128 (+) Transcript_2714:700-1083(+)
MVERHAVELHVLEKRLKENLLKEAKETAAAAVAAAIAEERVRASQEKQLAVQAAVRAAVATRLPIAPGQQAHGQAQADMAKLTEAEGDGPPSKQVGSPSAREAASAHSRRKRLSRGMPASTQPLDMD